MKPVDQTVSSHINGNCLEACVASILEVPLSDVPDVNGNPDWLDVMATFLAARGYAFLYAPHWPGMRPRGYHIASDRYHATVALDGRIVHCPHHSRAGVRMEIEYWYLVVPFGSALTLDLAA